MKIFAAKLDSYEFSFDESTGKECPTNLIEVDDELWRRFCEAGKVYWELHTQISELAEAAGID